MHMGANAELCVVRDQLLQLHSQQAVKPASDQAGAMRVMRVMPGMGVMSAMPVMQVMPVAPSMSQGSAAPCGRPRRRSTLGRIDSQWLHSQGA